EQGNPDAQIELAGFYEFGDTVPLDLPVAAEWFRKAANQGNAYAQNSLANYYFQGLGGVKQSLPDAAVLYQKAADQNDQNALWTLSILNIRGFLDKPDGAAGLKLLQRSAAEGSMRAAEDLGDCWRSGVYWGLDADKAQQWYEKAAAEGDAEAMFDLGDTLWYKPQENAKAVQWFTKAAELGHLQSQMKLAKAYSTGDRVVQDEAKAAKWYQAAAAQGSPVAAYEFKNLQLRSLDPAFNRKEGDHVVYTRKAIKEGDVITKDLVEEKLPEEPSVPEDAVPRKGLVIGKLARNDLSDGQVISRSDLSLPDQDPSVGSDDTSAPTDDGNE
ncbi:MAG: SAF domain-containing protein, partial [Terriglobales bacterium]